jgi:hypothetical protein
VNQIDREKAMKTVIAFVASLLLSAFVAVFHPNEYSWMQDEMGTAQMPEDADMMFKLVWVLVIHGVIQVAALFLLLRSGHKMTAIALGVISAGAALVLLQRV